MSRRRSSLVLVLALGAAGLPFAAATAASGAPACTRPGGGVIAAGDVPTVGFTPIDPVRILDTRDGSDRGTPEGRFPGDCSVAVDLPAAAVPAGADAVALNVTTVGAVARGFVTVFPCGAERPWASNVNPRPGEPTPSFVVMPVDATRRACVYASIPTHVVIDVVGWFGTGGDPYHPVPSTRLRDTRVTGDRLEPGQVRRIAVAGVGDVPLGASATAVNLTIVDADLAGYAVAYPCNGVPGTSTVNVVPLEARTNQTYVGLAPSGELCVRTSVAAELVIDLVGWFGPDEAGGAGLRLSPRVPVRLADSRVPGDALAGPLQPGVPFSLDVLATDAPAPHSVVAVLGVVATDAEAAGWVVLHPCGTTAPPTSSLNQVVGAEATNVVTVPIGDDGRVCGLASTRTHLVVDLLATFVADGPLTDLRTGRVALTPRFDPRGLDYTVRCPETGPLELPVSVRSEPGTVVAISGAGGSPARDRATTLMLAANDLVTITVQRGATVVATYAVRCLPHDFPVVRPIARTTPTPGWYLFANAFGPATGKFAVITDERGAVVWYRRMSTPILDLKRIADRTLAWVPLLATNEGFGIDPTTVYLVETLDGTQLRSYATTGGPTDHHDLVPLPGGHALLLTYEPQAGVTVPGAPACATAAGDVWWSNIEEVDAAGMLVWSWHSRDHLTPADSTYLPVQAIPGCDLQHADSLDVAPNGDVIVSMRHLDSVLRIRRNPGGADDGAIVWRLGGPNSSFTFVDDPYRGPARQHDARLGADGVLTVVDNRTGRAGETGRAVAYRLDEAAGVARLVWSSPFTAPVTGEPWSSGLGSVRRQPDGHTVVGWGDQAKPQFTEFDERGVPVLTVETADSWGYRVVKEPATAFDRADLRATAGR